MCVSPCGVAHECYVRELRHLLQAARTVVNALRQKQQPKEVAAAEKEDLAVETPKSAPKPRKKKAKADS